MRLDNAIPISSGLSCMEELAHGSGQALSAAALAGHYLSQAMKYTWLGMMRPHTSAGNAVEKGGCMENRRDASTRDLQ